ncbi:MAG: glycosyltransferase family 39 protein [Planctomycetota bacterium]
MTDNVHVNALETVEKGMKARATVESEARPESVITLGTPSCLPSDNALAITYTSRMEPSKNRQRRIAQVGLVGGIILFAILLRFANLEHASFCHTEAWRANWIREGDVSQARRFTPLFFLIHQAVQPFGVRSEAVLRFPSAVAGVVCVILVYGFSARVVGRRAACISALLTAVHPTLVYYSRKQLEYSFEACMSVALLWVGVATYRSLTPRAFAMFVIVAILGLGLTFTSAIAIAAWLAILGWAVFRASQAHRSARRAYLVAASALIVSTAGWYGWLSGAPNRDLMLIYYDSMEVVWPAAYTAEALTRWLVGAVYGVLQFTLGITDTWPPLNWFVASFEVLAICAALGIAWKRCRIGFVGVSLIVLGAIMCGAVRLWPLGSLRHSTFLIPFVTIITGWGFWRLWQQLGWSFASVCLAVMCAIIPSARAVKATMIAPRAYEHTRPLFDYVASHRQAGDAMFVYYFAVEAYKFYETPREIPVYLELSTDRANPELFVARFDEWISQHDRVWFISAHDWHGERDAWLLLLKTRYQELDCVETNDASLHLFARTANVFYPHPPLVDTIPPQGG